MRILAKLMICGLACALLLVGQAFTQSPQAFKYQAVVRDASNTPLDGQAIGVRLSVLEGSASGIVVYQETHAPTTSAIGLISLNVGEGTVVSGIFADIAWANDDHFLQIEVDETGGTNYAVLGTSQLLSVPYSLYAERAGSAAKADSVPGDEDQDPLNEIQDISLNGNDLSITDGSTVSLPTFAAGDGITISNNVISATNTAPSPWLTNSNGFSGESIYVEDTTFVAIGTNNPLAPLEVRTDSTAFRDDSIDISNLSFVVSKPSNSNTENGIGLGFGSSTDINNGLPTIGAAIIHQRTGGTSIGGLHFATKGTFGNSADIPIRMTLNSRGNLGIGTTSPTSRLAVSNGTTEFQVRPGILDGTPNAAWTTLEMPGENKLRVLDDLSVQDTLVLGTTDFPTDARLYVNGNIRLFNDDDIFGVDQIIGFNDLRFYGDPNITTTGGDFQITAAGNAGFHQTFSNVAVNIRNTGANTQILNAETTNGTNVFQIQEDQDVFVSGNFFVNGGTKNFILDHPLDPANKTLAHNAVESPDHVTYYDGTIQLDANGEAVVSLPTYFEALNKDFNYQLTCIGAFSQVYIAQEIANNQFTIAGGQPGMKVSWQVSARRNDPWAKAHPYQAEEEKSSAAKGKYFYPEGYGKGREYGIGEIDVNAKN